MRKLLVVALACLCGSANAQWFNTYGTFAVPDGDINGVDVQIVVSGAKTVLTDVNFGTVIDHTRQGDFIITLTSPSGDSSQILFLPGRPIPAGGIGYTADNYGNPADPTNESTWFVLDDQSIEYYNAPDSAPAGNVDRPGIPNVSDSWKPHGSMNSFFMNTDPNGTWTVNFRDFNTTNTGSVLMAGVQISAVPEPGTMIALGLGAVAVFARRRRKRA